MSKSLSQQALEAMNPRAERAGVWNVPEDAPSTAAERFLGQTGSFDVGAFGARLARLKAPTLLTADSTLRQHVLADWQHVDHRLQLWAARVIEVFRKQGVPLYVYRAFSPVDPLERPQVVSAHHVGCALDWRHSRYHGDLTPGEWAILGKFGRDLADKMHLYLIWGGLQDGGDPAHWECADWHNRPIPPPGDPVRQTPRFILQRFRGHD